jgi:hypothetical protein
VREHEVAWGHLLDIATDYAMGRMTPPDGFVEGDEKRPRPSPSSSEPRPDPPRRVAVHAGRPSLTLKWSPR